MRKEDWAGVGSDLMALSEEVRLQLRLARMEARRRLARSIAGSRRARAERLARVCRRAADIARALLRLGGQR